MNASSSERTIAVVICDLERAAIGTRSRLAEPFCGKPVLRHVLERLLAVEGLQDVAVLAPAEQHDRLAGLIGPEDRVCVMPLVARPAAVDARVRSGRAWNLLSWRGGAGQFTAFDEEYHPAAIAAAAREFRADHILHVHSHSVMLDVGLTSALLRHHREKNHELRVTYTAAAPGLSGMVLLASIVAEMGEKQALPWQLLAYDPAAPALDTLIRDACMQVDPALSKIPNRFCVDTDRSWRICEELAGREFGSAAELALAAGRSVAPGVKDLPRVFDFPREVEIELTGRRMTNPPGAVGAVGAVGGVAVERGELEPGKWVRWMERQSVPDDLLVSVGGFGDPLLYPDVVEVLRAARKIGFSTCLQTDLACGIEAVVAAIAENLLDVITISMYGHSAATYAQVAGADLHEAVMKNLGRLAEATRGNGGRPLVVPRLLKVRETIPEMEAFFDEWISRAGWAVIESPTDRGGMLASAAVVDMAPPKRRACRRLWDRLLIRSDGTGQACDQDAAGRLGLGNIENHSLQQLWRSMDDLRGRHAGGEWNGVSPCNACKEWHRP